ncbi:helix-turn-helix domain-containing protein [Dehalobacter sp. DCM]|uniref:PucR family transcriptional regulator n=1 Tax=Dehalobacter sp. DCM TaxID=2907827 RepID=UPI003081719C|nr:helix-turn-helix domain-containing protein [Dehalobacter sp. DCM]
MNLTQDIIYYSLSRKYPVQFLKRSDTEMILKRPMIYNEGEDCADRTIIILAEEMKTLADRPNSESNALYICLGKPLKSVKSVSGSVITLETEVAPAALFNAIQEIYDRFDQWDETLRTALYEGGSFGDLIDCTDPLVTGSVFLVDKMFHYVAYSKEKSRRNGLNTYMDENDNMTLDAVNDFIADSEFQVLYEMQGVFDYSADDPTFGAVHMICKNIFQDNAYAGRLIVGLEDPGDDAKRYTTAILQHLYFYINKLYQTYRSFDMKEIVLSSLRSLLLDSLNNREVSKEQWQKALEENGWTTTDRLQLIQFRQKRHYTKNIYAEFLSAEIERKWPGCACFEYDDRLLMLVNQDAEPRSEKGFYQAFAYFLRESLLIAGLSRIFTDRNQLRFAYNQTETALDFGLKKEPTLWYYKFDDYVLNYMLNQCTGEFSGEQLCSGKLLALKRHDTEKRTAYYETLRAYFKCRMNAMAAAKTLYIHRSSFLSRMDRIIELTGIDLDSDEEVFYLLLSFHLLENM